MIWGVMLLVKKAFYLNVCYFQRVENLPLTNRDWIAAKIKELHEECASGRTPDLEKISRLMSQTFQCRRQEFEQNNLSIGNIIKNYPGFK